MPARRVEYHIAVTTDVRAAVTWYAERSQRAAEEFEKLAKAAFNEIEARPERCRKYLWGTRRRLLHPFPYMIVYRLIKRTIRFLAVIHAGRRPGAWRERLRE